MKIVSLTLSGYRQFLEPTVLQFPQGLTGICGPNGVGKSKLVEAIGYALYGPSPHLLPQGDKAADLPSKAAARVVPRVALVLEVRGQRYEVIRSPSETSIRLQGAVDALAMTPTNVNQKVAELLRLSPMAYRGTFVALQNEVSGLQALRPQLRQTVVNRLIGIEMVEKAIEFARVTRGERNTICQTEQARARMTSTEAVQQHDDQRAAYEAALAQERALDAALSDARTKHDEATAQMEELRQRAEQAKALRQQQEDLADHQTTLEEACEQSRSRAAQAAAAAEKLAAAEQVLRETAEAPIELARHEELRCLAVLRERRCTLQRNLDDQLLPLLQERADLIAARDADDAALAALNDLLTVERRTCSLAEQAMRQARNEAVRHERRRQTAQELGPNGACETCGQVFGRSLGQALAHYTEEAVAARQQEAQARAQMLAAQAKAEQLKAQSAELQAARDARVARLTEYDAVPGEHQQALRTLADLDAQLEAFPTLLRQQNYDAAVHATAAAAVRRREQAESDARGLRLLAEQEGDARHDEATAEQALAALAERQRLLEGQIRDLALADDVVAEATAACAAAKTTVDEVVRRVRDASGQVAAARTRLETAEAELRRTQEQELRIAAAERSLRIAERTEEVLRRLLEEITAEARPRLAELMDTWARALMGPRFRRIDLTPDYRIVADNGSGLHGIGHFSGGEKTLLAIMLRVAISLFCRERAGFDTGFLILDEVFGNQDSEHRALLVQFLGEIKEQYHQILVVNHIEDVTNMLDSLIDVEPTGLNTSTARLRL